MTKNKTYPEICCSVGAFDPKLLSPSSVGRLVTVEIDVRRRIWEPKQLKTLNVKKKVGLSKSNIMLFCVYVFSHRIVHCCWMFENGFQCLFVFMCVWVCVIQNDFRLYVTIQKHLLNKVWPFVDLCFHVIIYSLIGILIHCGLTGILKGLFTCICMCVCVCLCF